MTLRQSHFVPPVPLIVAKRAGLVDERLLQTLRATGSEQQLEALTTGEVDIAVTAIDNLFAWAQQNPDLRLIGQVEETTLLGVFAHEPIDSLSELVGMRFGVDALSNGFSIVAQYILDDARDSIDFEVVGGVKERLDALVAGSIDATLLGPPFDEQARQLGAHEIVSVNSSLPEFPGQGMVVHRRLIDDPRLSEYLDAWDKAIAFSGELSEAQGIELLRDAGFGNSAYSAWTTRPTSLRVSDQGLALLTKMRFELGVLPDTVSLNALDASREFATTRRSVPSVPPARH